MLALSPVCPYKKKTRKESVREATTRSKPSCCPAAYTVIFLAELSSLASRTFMSREPLVKAVEAEEVASRSAGSGPIGMLVIGKALTDW